MDLNLELYVDATQCYDNLLVCFFFAIKKRTLPWLVILKNILTYIPSSQYLTNVHI